MTSSYSTIKDFLPEALRIAAEFQITLNEIELLRIQQQMEEMFLQGAIDFARRRKFIITYLAIRICTNLPQILIPEHSDLSLAS